VNRLRGRVNLEPAEGAPPPKPPPLRARARARARPRRAR